jgi:hypothetical protein
MSASYPDLHLGIDNGVILKTKHYEKLDNFTFSLVNFAFIRNNISL